MTRSIQQVVVRNETHIPKKWDLANYLMNQPEVFAGDFSFNIPATRFANESLEIFLIKTKAS